MEDLSYDPINWMASNLKIVTMEAELSPLRCNDAQLKVHNSLELQRKAGFPMRALVLKARREGVSTYTEGRFFYEINVRRMHNACVCSADIDATNKVFKMAKTFQDNMPAGLRRETDYSNRKEITYTAPHMSQLVAQTAGKGVLGRGGLTHYLHATEFAFWDNAKEQLGGASQEIPDDDGTIIVIESTANGVGGAFYDMFMQAYDDYRHSRNLMNYLPIFLPWYIFGKYVAPAPADFEIGKPHTYGILDEWLEPEEELVRAFHCTKEQLMWRRWAIKNKCQGDLSLFKQEYPATLMEAFQSTGRPVFNHSVLDKQLEQCPKTGRYGLFVGNNHPDYIDVHQSYNCWRMQVPVRQGHQYCMGIDTKEDRLSDPKDLKSKSDRHGVMIFDRTTNEFVCMFHGDIAQHELGEQCVLAARYYNNAWVAPEIPLGMQVLRIFTESGYENLYNRQIHDEQFIIEDSDNLGWRTTLISRKWMIDSFVSVLNNIKLMFPALIEEMRTFVYDKNGKPTHMPGRHDDLLFGAMIAIQVHTRCPFSVLPYPYAFTDEGGRKVSYALNVSGCIDIDDDEEDEWLFTE